MKNFNKVFATVMIIAVILGAPLLFFACSSSEETHIIVEDIEENITSEKGNSSCEEDEPKDNPQPKEKDVVEKEEEIFVKEINVPKIIYLENNGTGVQFCVNIYPEDFTTKVNIEVRNFLGPINKNSKSATEEKSNIAYMEDGYIYPLAEGEVYIVVWAVGEDGEIIRDWTKIIVKNPIKILKSQIFDDKNQEVSTFKSAQKADKSWEIYTAVFTVSENLNLDKTNIDISAGVVLDEIRTVDNKLYIDFHLTIDGEHKIKINIEDMHSSAGESTEEISFISQNFIQELAVNFLRSDSSEPLIQDEKLIIYYFDDEELSLLSDNSGHFTNYILSVCDNKGQNLFGQVCIYSKEGLLCIEGGSLVAKGCGEDTLFIYANDSSGQIFSIKVCILSPSCSFMFNTEDSEENIEYLFDTGKIIVSNFSTFKKEIIFNCNVYDFLGNLREKDIRIEIFGDYDCVERLDIINFECVYIKIRSTGEFAVAITDTKTGISETIYVVVNE